MAQGPTNGGENIFSPEGVLMLSLAGLIDVSEFFVEFIPVAGQILSVIIDIVALLIIGGWMYFRSSIKGSGTREPPRPQKAKKKIKKIVKGAGELEKRLASSAKWAKRLKWLRPLCIIVEMIPIIGSLPLWIVAVYFELKYA